MSVHIDNAGRSDIGSMFARLQVSETYGRTKPEATGRILDENTSIDRVSLSSRVPKPLPARLFEEAADTGRELARGGRLAPGKTEKLREDRVFAAVSALSALAENGSEIFDLDGMSWPGGIPVPTREEMEAARQRLAQRLKDVDAAGDPDAARREREELWFRVAKKDLAGAAGKGESLAGAGRERDGKYGTGR
ncbi:MAG: hypothetical protein LBE84_12280 [Planctomycetota bacterium]|jgi:hypothetical protein|nr:hypothetical protein [Planctomycetota bacterium]